MAAILVYDVTCRESYNHLPNWLSDVTEQGNPNMFVIAVGNKKDLVVDRQVSYLEASVFCQENNILLIECSALTGEGITDVFHTTTSKVLARLKSGELKDTKYLSNRGHMELEEGKVPDNNSQGLCKRMGSCLQSLFYWLSCVFLVQRILSLFRRRRNDLAAE